MDTSVSASWLVVEDPVVGVVGVGSSTSGVVGALPVGSDDTEGLDGVAAAVSSPVVAFLGSDVSLLPDDDVVVCLSLSDDVSLSGDVPAPAFEFDDFDGDEPEPVEPLLDDDDDPEVDAPPLSLLDDAPEPESSACATPAPLSSAIPIVTAPTPSQL